MVLDLTVDRHGDELPMVGSSLVEGRDHRQL